MVSLSMDILPAMLCYAVLYCTVCLMLCYAVCTVLYALCYAVLFCTVCAMLYVLWCGVVWCGVEWCAVVICSIRYFTVLNAPHVPYYAMLCYIILFLDCSEY